MARVMRMVSGEPRVVEVSEGFHLDVPPSANARLTISSRGRVLVKTREMREWERDAMWELRRQSGCEPVEIPVRLEILAHLPRVNRDIDNVIKPTLDVLVKVGLLDDDDIRRVPGVSAEHDPAAAAKGRMLVRLLGKGSERGARDGMDD